MPWVIKSTVFSGQYMVTGSAQKFVGFFKVIYDPRINSEICGFFKAIYGPLSEF